jgi:hypothetical protein
MVGQQELEDLILARLDPTIKFCADVSGVIEANAGDEHAKQRLRKMIDHVRREGAAFAVRVEAAGPFATPAAVEQVMGREFGPVTLAKAGVLDMVELLLDRGALVDRVETV